ncbi:MAG: terpene cyclase/mutase family protein [Gemmatimonadales bacterium]|jgi:hypothetical protein
MRGPRWLLGRALDLRLWRPAHAAYVWRRAGRRGGAPLGPGDSRRRIAEAASWLTRAQDATGDGGVAGRYRLDSGWSSSYPETTGYLIPTFLRLHAGGHSGFEERAERALDFLLRLQLPSGAFPGGEVAENLSEPSVFNTAQILHGLLAWAAHTGDAATGEAAGRAGEWLVSVQDEDGAWREHVYRGTPTTYVAHASCWLAEAGRQLDRPEFLAAAGRHLDWVLGHQDPATGWFDLCGFSEADHRARQSVTHTIAYTVWGVLFAAEVLHRDDGIAAARRAAEAIGRRLASDGRLAGVLDHEWRPRADWTCVTGNCQMALIWQRLARRAGATGEAGEAGGGATADYQSWARRALELAAGSQSLTSAEDGIRGGLPGSDPVWGDYIYAAFPNWAAKFFLDALMNEEDAVSP